MTWPLDHLSASLIARYRDCPLSALYYRRGEPSSADPRYRVAGSIVHSLIEREYDPSAEPYSPECPVDDMMQSRIDESMAGYRELRQRGLLPEPSEAVRPEVYFEAEIGGVPLVGYIDLLYQTETGWRVEDWKTGSPRQKDRDQMRIYAYALEQTLGARPSETVATLDYLRLGRREAVPYTSSEAVEDSIVRDVVEPVENLEFPANRGSRCSMCEYRPICKAWAD